MRSAHTHHGHRSGGKWVDERGDASSVEQFGVEVLNAKRLGRRREGGSADVLGEAVVCLQRLIAKPKRSESLGESCHRLMVHALGGVPKTAHMVQSHAFKLDVGNSLGSDR